MDYQSVKAGQKYRHRRWGFDVIIEEVKPKYVTSVVNGKEIKINRSVLVMVYKLVDDE